MPATYASRAPRNGCNPVAGEARSYMAAPPQKERIAKPWPPRPRPRWCASAV